MKKTLRLVLNLSTLMLVIAPQWSRAQDHLLITEFVVTPTAGEFVEIHNPTANAVDLSNYYLTDEVFNNNNNYINVVKGGFTAFSSDFMVKFPNGAGIGPKQFLTIAVSGAGFTTTYGKPADFEIKGDDANTPDMTAVSVGASVGFTNGSEILILFYWNGQSDLVQDVDIVQWGDKTTAVNKTGVSIDGPDADTDASTYLADTPVANQFVVNAENDADSDPHDVGNSAQRRLDVEDVETWTGGNGIAGHDETSENLSWKGGIWSINAPATPGWRALGDSLNIADLQFVRANVIGATGNEDSPFRGDTVTVTGVVMHGIREVFVGARWGVFMQDERGGPWSGIFAIQNDSTIAGTLFSAVLPGDKIRVTGLLNEFPTTANTASITQIELLTRPAVPVEFVDFGLPTPAPIVLTPGDLQANGAITDPKLTERWESVLARFNNLTVIQNFAGQAGNIMTAGDASGSIALDDYFDAIFDVVSPNGGAWPGLPAGTRINVTGYIRAGTTQGTVTINPRTMADIEIASSPPSITNVSRNPVVVTSTTDPEVSATIVDAQGAVARAHVNYTVDNGPVQRVSMSTSDNTVFRGVIPRQANGAFVQYYITAVDASNDSTDAANAQRSFYYVRDNGLTIFDVQYTPFDNGNSGYSGLTVTVEGVATTDSADFGYYYLQDGRAPWSGIWVNDNVNNVKLGDRVRVTGTAQENFNVTRIGNVTAAVILSTGNAVPEPVEVKTGELRAGRTAEQYEGMLVRVLGAKVTNPFPDGASNFGEFSINDGTGEVRVDDEAAGFRGNLDSTFALGDSLVSITGIHYFSFSNYKMLPRNDNDVIRFSVKVDENPGRAPQTYALEQNYPNPFNPETTIRYQLAQKGRVTIVIFNVLGQKVKTLVDENKAAGSHRALWNGRDDHGVAVPTGMYFYRMQSGEFAQVRKLLLLK